MKTATDTEVILHIYQEHGEEGFEKLNGMWAFAIADLARHRVVLSRDRFSIKPLYILQVAEGTFFGSEIKQLLPFLHKRVGAILTTSLPESCHIIDAQAKKVLGCPWIADLRDLWTQNLAEQTHSSLPLRLRLEKKTPAVSDALVTVSAPGADRLRQRYPARSIHIVTNNFDPGDSRRRQLTKTFSITYAGQLNERKGDPSSLLHPERTDTIESLTRGL